MSIKHKALISSTKNEYYLCNQAVIPNEKKLVFNWNNVNCKNCLKQRYRTH